VPGIVQTQFHFLEGSKAEHEVVLGDARLSQDREKSKPFDVLAVDAFSGDAIPGLTTWTDDYSNLYKILR
jgi:hypothetical protein